MASREFRAAGANIRVQCYTACADLFTSHRRIQEALELLRSMREEKLPLDSGDFAVTLTHLMLANYQKYGVSERELLAAFADFLRRTHDYDQDSLLQLVKISLDVHPAQFVEHLIEQYMVIRKEAPGRELCMEMAAFYVRKGSHIKRQRKWLAAADQPKKSSSLEGVVAELVSRTLPGLVKEENKAMKRDIRLIAAFNKRIRQASTVTGSLDIYREMCANSTASMFPEASTFAHLFRLTPSRYLFRDMLYYHALCTGNLNLVHRPSVVLSERVLDSALAAFIGAEDYAGSTVILEYYRRAGIRTSSFVWNTVVSGPYHHLHRDRVWGDALFRLPVGYEHASRRTVNRHARRWLHHFVASRLSYSAEHRIDPTLPGLKALMVRAAGAGCISKEELEQSLIRARVDMTPHRQQITHSSWKLPFKD